MRLRFYQPLKLSQGSATRASTWQGEASEPRRHPTWAGSHPAAEGVRAATVTAFRSCASSRLAKPNRNTSGAFAASSVNRIPGVTAAPDRAAALAQVSALRLPRNRSHSAKPPAGNVASSPRSRRFPRPGSRAALHRCAALCGRACAVRRPDRRCQRLFERQVALAVDRFAPVRHAGMDSGRAAT